MPYVPKTNWQYDEAVPEQDLNRIEQGIADATATAEAAETPAGAQAKVDTAMAGITPAGIGAAPASHGHSITQVTDLQTTLDEKAPVSHGHPWEQITGTPVAYPPVAHQHNGSDVIGQVPDSAKLGGVAAAEFERSVNAQAKADLAIEEGLVIEAALPVEGAEPEQVATTKGPAVQFSATTTQSVQFCRRWPFSAKAMQLELLIAASAATAGSFRLQIGWQVNGGAVTQVVVSVTPGSTTNLYTAALGQIIPAASLPAGALVTITLSRLGADAADTHTGALQLHLCRLKRG